MSVAALEGRIYVLGGYPSTRISTNEVQVYDPAADRWEFGPPLPAPLNHTASASLGGRLYVIGGQVEAGGAGPFVDTVYALDPATGTWTRKAPMPTPRAGAGCAVVAGRIYVAGGRPPHGQDFAAYDPSTDTWQVLPPLPTPRNHAAVAAAGGEVVVAGGRLGAGFTSELTDVVESYDLVAARWRRRAPLPRPRGGMIAVEAGGRLHAFGGEGNREAADGLFADHDVFDPAREAWDHLADMPRPVHGVTGAAFVGGRIHLPGGGTAQGGSSGSTLHQVYVPARAVP